MKSGKEIILNIKNKNFKVNVGAIENYKSPNAIYLNINSWIKLKREPHDVSSLIRNIKCLTKKIILESIDEEIFNKYDTIIDFDISHLSLKNGKSAFLSIEINLDQSYKRMLPLIQLKTKPSPDLMPYIYKIVYSVINDDIFNENEYLIFNKKKKFD